MPTFRSFAKINWHLEVVGRRGDGYHELRTLFQTIDWCDELEIDVVGDGRGVELTVEGAEIPHERNLAGRAATLFLDAWGRADESVRIVLRKRVPAGGGLGAGSANAATVLTALARLLRQPDPGWLATAARRLGADVPFFLTGGLALGTERGDAIRELPQSLLPEREVWLALPPQALATADVFAAVRPGAAGPPGEPVRAALAGEPLPEPDSALYRNDLESAAFALSPAVAAVYTALQRSGARLVRMSGSGSTIFACFDDPVAARAAAASLPSGTVWKRVRSIGREAWRRASGLDSSDGGV